MNRATESADPDATMTLAEFSIVATCLGAIITTQLVLSKSLYLFHHNFWVDEIYTHTLVSDPDLAHSVRAIADGTEANPPTFHLLLRALAWLVGDTGEVTLRCLSLAFMFVALLGIYAIVRRLYFPSTAFAATLVVWNHPLILMHAFEVRFYGPWLAATVWFAYLLTRTQETPEQYWPRVLLAPMAALLCTIHYFGIFTLGLVVGFELLSRLLSGKIHWSRLWPVALGPLALLACLPFYLSQRVAAYGVSWVDPPNLSRFVAFAMPILLPGHLAMLVLVTWISGVARGCQPLFWGEWAHLTTPSRAAPLTGLVGLVLLPLVLLIVSYTVQPVLIDRYAIPAVAALALAAAYAISRESRSWIAVISASMLACGIFSLSNLSYRYKERDQKTAELIAAVREHTDERPVLFESPHELYVVCRYAPDVAGRCLALDFEPAQFEHVDNRRLFLRDAVRIYAKSYPQPALIGWDAARRMPKRYLVPQNSGLPHAEDRYPGFKLIPVENGLYELVAARDVPASP